MDVDDATPQEFIVAAVREVLRSLLMYWLPSDLAREDEHALLQLFRGFITLLTTKDSDTNFLCQQALNKRPIHWDSALTSHQECVLCCLMINAAGAFSPSKDALDYRDDAIHALSELPPFSVENNYLRYTNQDVALVISDYDLSLLAPLFETDYEWEIPRGAYLPLTASLNAEYWLFWRAFFRALISGENIDLELWHDIALIADHVWKAGSKAVAEEIDKIKNARSLEGKIEAFEVELLRLASEPLFEGNAHNGGPPLEDHRRRFETIQLIRAQLDILKEEVAKRHSEDETPDPGIIERVVAKIVALIKKHFIIAGAVVFFTAGAATKITEDAIDHYRVSETIFQTVDDVVEAATRYIQSLRTSSSKGRND
jgi:hypothetical protein